jgi:galactokinase
VSGLERADLFERIRAATPPGAAPDVFLWVPGRIEFLGKHTDYAGGRSLVGAVERGIGFTAVPRSDRAVTIRDVLSDLETSFLLDAELAPQLGTWASYGMVAARRLARNFPGMLRGADIYFASNLPPSAGMSSSSALISGIFWILARANQIERHPAYRPTLGTLEQLAEYLGAVENGSSCGALAGDQGVGTAGGSQDHAAILLSEPGALLQCRFHPLHREASIGFPSHLVFVIGVSGVVAEKTGSAMLDYNRVSRVTGRILAYWNTAMNRDDPTLMGALAQHPEAHHQLREILESIQDEEFGQGTLLARLEQFVMETTVIIPDTADALRRGDLAALTANVDLSQMLAERMLGNQVPETIALCRLARDLGATAASSFGAGFGGSVYAVVEKARATAFLRQWSARYLAEFPLRAGKAEFLLTGLGPPLTEIA